MRNLIVSDREFIGNAPNLLELLALENADCPDDPQDRARGVLLGLAAGNLLGIPVEGLSGSAIRGRFPNGVTEIDPGERRMPMDDDLAQAVDLGESLLDSDDGPVNAGWVENFSAKLVRWRRENGRGIGITTSAVIELLEAGVSPPEAGRLIYEGNNRIAPNGAVMRCAPVSLLWHSRPARLIEDSPTSAMVTHYSPLCQWSCLIINATIALLLGGNMPDLASLAGAVLADGCPAEVAEWVGEVGEDIESLRWDHPHTGHTLLCMQFGLWAARTPLTLEEALVKVMDAGGDTDTNGAVAGAVLGARYGARGIPERWLNCVPQQERLESLALKLWEAAP
ncbi:MAG: ADP-ribosylglycohydrolase family protein [Chloroflexota bacterium]|nr:ADP-ribosylglycohydrolase family protein [Chloroflexota bacterium]